MQNDLLKTGISLLRQTWGKAKNQESFMKSAINLLQQGESDKALSLLKSIKESQEFHNELLSAQIKELESRIHFINSKIVKPQYTTQDWEEHHARKNGQIAPTEAPPMDAPPLTGEYYSEPCEQQS